MNYASVAVNVPGVSGVFDYQVPASLQAQLKPGCLVTVPFGPRTVQGIITELKDSTQVAQVKDLIELIDPQPVVNAHQLALAGWMSEAYLSSLVDTLPAMVPPGLSQQADSLFSLTQQDGSFSAELTPLQKRMVDLIRTRGPLRGRQLDAAIPRQNWRQALKPLLNRGWLVSQSVLPKPAVSRKMVKTAQLACSPATAETEMDALGRVGSAALQRRQAIVRFLMTETLPVNVSWVYAQTGGNLADLQALQERELVSLGESEVWRDPLADMEVEVDTPPQLTPDQQSAWKVIAENISLSAGEGGNTPILIHGVTGSGKTELYLRAVEEVLHQGLQAIILVPEISLTPQTVRRFAARFPGQVGLVHSRLSPGERYDTWRRARAGLLNLVIGPRSALFTPFERLGLIVVDECHDDTYYQGDMRPYYHAVECAVAYSRLAAARVLLGSATPSVEMLYSARHANWIILNLPLRILAHREVIHKQLESMQVKDESKVLELNATAVTLPLPMVHIVDMREELKAGNRSLLSRRLHDALAETLTSHQQAILFLNRRGAATYVFCRACGYVARCPRCDLPLTLHADTQQLVCHMCGYQRKSFSQCPQCDSSEVREYGAGTQKVEQLVRKEFPAARVLRWDADTVRHKGAEEILLSHFIHHRADVLIGTQMLAKGLDLPLVTLVGVVLADVGLNFPDYRSAERTFQLITQVAGRAGRSVLGGQAVVQTFQPWHYSIQLAARHDYDGFYQQELEFRRKLGYPPFSQLIRMEFSDYNWAKAKTRAEQLYAQMQQWLDVEDVKGLELIGPVPPFFARLSGRYRWQILLMGADPLAFLRDKNLPDWKIEVNPPDLL
jgi:primosomal protein N' (replication factor Y)